jgi:TonB family protein
MRKQGLILAMLALTAGAAGAQQELPPSTNDGPLNIKPIEPKPDKDGVYSLGPGIVAPIVLERAAAVYPADAPTDAVNGFCALTLVVGSDGVAAGIEVTHSHGSAFDLAAIEAVKQTRFDPGTLDGKAVPVRIEARIHFFADRRPAYPRIVRQMGPQGGMGWSGGGGMSPSRPYDKPPVATYTSPAVYSDKARKAKFQGIVLISVLVTEEGEPTDIRVERSLGMGLDEKAVESVSRYKFLPAMKDGAPVAARIMVEVSFRLY